jgi:hypothetical protein
MACQQLAASKEKEMKIQDCDRLLYYETAAAPTAVWRYALSFSFYPHI